MLPLNLFFADQWIFRTLYFEESLSGERLLPELARRMGYVQGDIVQILVVPSGIISVPQSVVRDKAKLLYEQNASALVPIGGGLSLQDIFCNTEPTHLHLVVRTGVVECIYVFRLDTRELDYVPRSSFTTPIPHIMPADESRGSIIYKPLNRIPLKPAKTLKDRVDLTDRSSWKEVSVADTLEDAYPLGLSRDIIHFVVDRRAPALIASIESEESSTPRLSMVDVRRLYFAQNATEAPSARGQLTSVMETQFHDHSALLCGRPFNREAVVPASHFDENLFKFRHNLNTIIPTPADVESFYLLRCSLTGFFDNEAERCNTLTDVLTKGIIPAESVLRRGSVSDYDTDGDLRVDTVAGSCIYFLQEVKNEVGQGGAIPEFEAPHCWIEQIRVILDSWALPQSDLAFVNFPVILLQHFGPYLAVAVAIFSERPIVEPLACVALGVHSTNTAHLAIGMRLVASLRVGLRDLKAHYESMLSDSKPRRLANYPFRDYYTVGHEQHHFTYTGVLEGKCVFRATLADGTAVVVKFARRYGEAAHQKAHTLGFAPKLMFSEYVHGWYIVVMEDVTTNYETLYDAWNRLRHVDVPPFQQNVKARLKQLQQGGFIHGDIRSVNVLVRKPGVARTLEELLFVDWDWAGVEGQVEYPVDMNPAVWRPPTAHVGGVITHEHDIAMASRLGINYD